MPTSVPSMAPFAMPKTSRTVLPSKAPTAIPTTQPTLLTDLVLPDATSTPVQSFDTEVKYAVRTEGPKTGAPIATPLAEITQTPSVFSAAASLTALAVKINATMEVDTVEGFAVADAPKIVHTSFDPSVLPQLVSVTAEPSFRQLVARLVRQGSMVTKMPTTSTRACAHAHTRVCKYTLAHVLAHMRTHKCAQVMQRYCILRLTVQSKQSSRVT